MIFYDQLGCGKSERPEDKELWELKEVSISTLYTCGRYDEATPKSTKLFSELKPNSKFYVFENSAHMPYLEETEEYLQIISQFLQKVDL